MSNADAYTPPAAAWGFGTFANDDALDWLGELLESKRDARVRKRLTKLLADMDATEASEVLAAEVVVAMCGRPCEEMPEELSDWLAGRKPPGGPVEALVKQARIAVELVLARSELRDLWAESDEFEAWQAAVRGLLKRLG